ncbi:MAG: PilZ domain-containing protein [Nitrospinota bacterium]|nr:PilZ domain-containing protein [Nitrospinota bacterium]
MFWKKKNKQEKKFKAPEEARQAYRVAPDPESPIFVNLEGQSLEVLEISSGGLAFKNKGFRANATYGIDFVLPTGGGIKTRIRILRIDEEDICRCNFINLSTESEDALHRYVLVRQKDDLRSQNP